MMKDNGKQEDHNYIKQWTIQAHSRDELPPPDLSRMNGYSEIAQTLYDAHRQGGPALALQTWNDTILKQYPDLAQLTRRKLYHADELDTLPPQSWLVENEIPANGLTVMFGPSGSGKSFMALDYAEQISQETGSVVYIAAEGRSGYNARHKAWKQHHRSTGGDLHFWLDAVNMLDQTDLSEFIAEVQHLNPKMIVIDTLARCMLGGDENSARDMGVFVDACGVLQRELKAAVLVVHHTGKTGNSERGSSALRGAADMMIEIGNADGLISVKCSKAKDSAEFESKYFRLIPVQDTDSCVPVPSERVILDDGKLTNNEQVVIETLSNENLFGDGAKYTHLLDATGLAKSSLWAALNSLTRKDLIVRTGKFEPYVLTSKGKDLAKKHNLVQFSSELVH